VAGGLNTGACPGKVSGPREPILRPVHKKGLDLSRCAEQNTDLEKLSGRGNT
jgi:hypothetical protein